MTYLQARLSRAFFISSQPHIFQGLTVESFDPWAGDMPHWRAVSIELQATTLAQAALFQYVAARSRSTSLAIVVRCNGVGASGP